MPGERDLPNVVSLADVEPVEPEFLVRPYLPRGKICILDGDPDAGKTTLAVYLAAALSSGSPVPFDDDPHPTRGPVLYFVSECDVAQLKRCVSPLNVDVADFKVVQRVPPLKTSTIYRKLLEAHRPALLVIDPIQEAFAGESMNSATKVRALLSPFVGLAREFNCTILFVRHLAKGGGKRSMLRGIGSVDFAATARSVLRFGVNPNEPEQRVLVHLRSDSVRNGPAQEFYIDGGGRLKWMGRTDLRARDLDGPDQRSRGASAVARAEALLRKTLADGPRKVVEIQTRATEAGVSSTALKRAKKSVRVRSFRKSVPGGSPGAGEWWWETTEDDPEENPVLHIAETVAEEDVLGSDDTSDLSPAPLVHLEKPPALPSHEVPDQGDQEGRGNQRRAEGKCASDQEDQAHDQGDQPGQDDQLDQPIVEVDAKGLGDSPTRVPIHGVRLAYRQCSTCSVLRRYSEFRPGSRACASCRSAEARESDPQSQRRR